MQPSDAQNTLSEQRLTSVDGAIQKLKELSPKLLSYVYERCFVPHEAMHAVQATAAQEPMGFMQTAPDQAALLYMLAKISNARSVLEVGCYLGHSALAILSALPRDGKLVSLDYKPSWAALAQAAIDGAGFSEQFELRVANARESLEALSKESPRPQYDLVFIDADKVNALVYYKLVVELVRPGGLIVADNVLWRGHIVDDTDQSERAVALRSLNDFVKNDSRVESLILTVSDGMLIARVKEGPVDSAH